MTCDDDEFEAVAGDPERFVGSVQQPRLRSEAAAHPFWVALNGIERVAVIRWLQCGEARELLNALSENPSSDALRLFVSEGLAGGIVTGWRLRITSPAIGGAPRKADKARLDALQTALASDGGDVANLARAIAALAIGERSRRGRSNNPMRTAMVGMDLAFARERSMPWKQAIYDVACIYGYSEKNVERLNADFWKAGR